MFSCRMCSHIECVLGEGHRWSSKQRSRHSWRASGSKCQTPAWGLQATPAWMLPKPAQIFQALGNLVCMDWLMGFRSLFTPLVPLSIACYFSPSPSPVTRLLLLLGSRHTTRPAHAGVGGHHTTVSSLFFIAYPQTRVPAPSVPGLCAGTAVAGPNPLSIALFSAS